MVPMSRPEIFTGAKYLTTNRSAAGEAGLVTAVERALSLLDAFADGEHAITLTELAYRSNLSKPTALRLAKTLAHCGYLVRNNNASWSLGAKLAKLGYIYQSGFRLEEFVVPVLHDLSRETGESATFYILENDSRVCLFRVQSPQSIGHVTKPGDRFPLPLGAPGRILLAFGNEPGELYETIRQQGYHVTLGERDPQVSSVSCPIFSVGGRLEGALTVAGPTARFDEATVERYLGALRAGAAALNRKLGGL
jgi:DNA-binding IclR family transcriptional regulator